MATEHSTKAGNPASPQSGEPLPALYDLEGELGQRARIAWGAAIEIEQCTTTLRDLQGRDPAESDRVIPLLLRRVEALANVIMSCTSADDTLESLRERAGMEGA